MDNFGSQPTGSLSQFFFGGGGSWEGCATLCELYLQELYQVPTVNMGEKSPRAASWKRVKLTIMKPVSQLLESYPNLTDLGEGKYPTAALSNLPHGGGNMPNTSHHVLPRESGRKRGGMRT